MEFRDALKSFRSEVGVVQADIASALHINIATVARWEQGKTIPNRSTAMLLLEYAKSRCATSLCIENLEKTLAHASRKRLLSGKNNLFTVEHSTIAELIEDATAPIYVCDLQTDEVLYVNRATEQKLGKTFDEIVGKKCYECIMNRVAPCEFCNKSELVDDSFKGHDTFLPFNGNIYYVQGKIVKWNGHHAQARLLHEQGMLSELTHTGENYTEATVAPKMISIKELSAKCSNAHSDENATEVMQLKPIFDNINCGISVVTYEENGAVHLAYANDLYYKLFGYTREQFFKELKTPHDTTFIDDRDIAASFIAKVKATKQAATFRYRIVKRDKSIAHVRCNSSVVSLEGTTGFALISILTDITESVQTEQQSIVFGRRLDAIMKNMNSAVTASVVKSDGTVEFLFSNDLYHEMLGYTKEQYQAEVHEPCQCIYPDDLKAVQEAVFSLRSEGEIKDLQYRVSTRDGKIKWLRVHVTIMKFPDADEPVQLAVYSDITNIVKAQELIIAQRDQISGLLNDTPGGIAIVEVDPNDIVNSMHTVYYNDRFISFSGYDRAEYDAMLKNNEMAFVFKEDIPVMLNDIKKICGGEIGKSADTTIRCHTKDGGFRWLLLTGQLSNRRNDICVINIAVIDVTERKEATDRQRINEEMLRIAAETDHRSMIVYDVKKNTCRAESRTLFSARYGDVFENIPQSLIDIGLTSPDSEDTLCSLFARIREGEKQIRVSLQLRSGHDKYEWFECNASTVFDTEGLPDHAVLVFHNITEQRVKEAVFKKWQQSIEARPPESYTLFRCNLSKDASLDQQNGTLLNISFPADEMSFNGRTKLYADEFVYPDDREDYFKLLDSDILLAMYYRGEHFAALDYREIAANGEYKWRRLTIEMVEYPNSKDVEAFLMYEDIDEQKKEEIAELERANSDPLTGALNRSAFAERVEKIIAENPNSKSALIMLDMDGFKQINDTLGHGTGDHALQEVVAVLNAYSRNGDLVCRLGGDEFMVWLNDVPYDAAIAKTAQQMCEHICKAYSEDILLSASIGIAVYPRDGCRFEDLYHNADKALYKMKQSGKGSFAFFSVTEEQTEEISPTLPKPKKNSFTPLTKKHRMLIVDDSETSRLMLKSIFKDEYLIETAKNGADAMIRLRHFGVSISVVLLDLLMPDMDGFAVLKRMQSDVDLRMIPVIVVTGDENRETLLKAIELGAAEYVTKPVDNDIIHARVQSVINKADNERLRAQNSYLMLQQTEEVKYRTVLESTGTAVVEYDWRNHVYIYDGEISKRIAGNFNHRGLWQVFLSDMVAASSDVKILQDTLISLSSDKNKTRESKLVQLKTPKGVKHWFRINIYKNVDDFGLAEKMIITFNDVHEEVLANDKLLFQATRDELTGLYNRAGFLDKATELINAKKQGYYVMACIDVENFRIINDRYGTEKGDEVLRHIAATVDGFVRSNNGICCRYTADRFAILYPANLINSEELKENHRIASSPDCIPGPLRLRIGRCMVNDTSLPVSAIFDRATMAEAHAKGRYDTYIIDYDESMRDKILKDQQIVGDMVAALQNGEFEPWFQPQYNHATGAIIGAEALVRWRQNGKIISPNDFIPVFERNGFIYEVDRYIWRSVCALLRRWLDEGKNPLPVSVNISRYDLLQKDFMESICSMTEEFKLPVDLLRLEVTESAFLKSYEKIYAVVNELIEKGYTVEIDDFGSGYSSLNTLKDVAASILKLDMRFFEKTGDAKRGGNIIESVVRMAKWLGMAVIAEGVEDKAQADYLKSIGCVYIQGYFYAKPMPVDEYEKRLESASKEGDLVQIQTVQHLDQNDFWDSHSMDSLIFNSYVGAACILELSKGKVEMLRATDHYVQMLCGNALSIKDVLAIDWVAHMDNRNFCLFTDAVMESLETKNSVTWEFEFHDLPECPKLCIIRSTLRVIATAGERVLIYCLNENITDQRMAERVAKSATERINAVMDHCHSGITAVIARPDGSVELLFVNNRFFEIMGYTREQYASEVESPYDRVFPEDRDRVFETIINLNKVGTTASLELREIRRDGSIVWLRWDASVVRFANISEPVQLANFLDITEQKEKELKHLEDARKLEVIMANINGGVSAIRVADDATSKVVFNNENYYELYGYTKEEALAENLDIMTCIFPEDLPNVMAKIKQMKKDRQPCIIDYRIVKKDGSYAMLRVNASPMSMGGYDDVVTGVVTDITERKSLEERLGAIIDNINGGISAVYLKKDKPEYALANEQYYRILGYTKEEFEAESVNPFDLVHPDDRDMVIKKFAEMQKFGERYTMEYRIIRRDGAERNILCNTAVLQLFGIDEPLQLAVSNDITELREAQRQEYAVNDRLNTVMNTMSDGMTAVVSRDNRLEVLFTNNRFYEIHGITCGNSGEEDLAAAIDLVLPAFKNSIHEAFTKAEKTWQTVSYECQIQRPDGVIRWLRVCINMANLVGIDAPVRVSVFSDITDEKKANDQIRFLNESAGRILAQSDSEKAINETLKKLLTYFAGDRTYIFELNGETQTSDNTYEFCASGVKSEMDRLQGVPYKTQQCWFDAFDKTGFVTIPDVAAITDENEIAMRELMLVQNIRSIIVAPLWRDDKLIGYIGIDNPTKALDQVSQLMALADYIAVLLTRRDLMKSIEHGQQTLQQLMDDTPGGFLRLHILPDNTASIVSLNVGFCRMLGMTTDEVMSKYGDNAHKCLVVEDMPLVENTTAEAFAGNGVYTYKCRLKKKDGAIIWVQVFGRFVKDENGELFRNSFFTDITAKLAEEENQKTLLDNLPFGAAMYEFDGKSLKALHINQQYQIMVGRTRNSANLEGFSPTDFIHPDDRIVTINAIKYAIDNNKDGSCNIRVRYGEDEYRFFHIDARIVAQPDGKYLVYAAYTRLSEQELTFENALPHMFSTIMEASTDLAFAKDINFRYICCSKTFATLLGLKSEKDVVGKTDYELFPQEIADMFRRDDTALFATQKPQIDIQEMIPSPDGTKHYIRTSKHLMRSETDSIIGIYCIGRDVTEIREAYARLRLLTDSIPGGIATFRYSSDKVETIYINDGVCELAGFSRKEYDAHPVPLLDLIFAEDKPIIRRQIDLMKNGKNSFNFTIRIHLKNGGYRWINCVATVTDSVGDDYVVNAVLTDVTEQQEEKEHLRLAEEEYRIATEHSARTICRYNIAEMSLKVAHETATRFALPPVIQGVPYEQAENGSVSPDTVENYISFFEKILQGEKVCTCVFCKKLNNSWRWLSARSTTIFDRSEKPVSAIISFRDITEEQEKEIIFKKWKQSLTDKKPEKYTLYRCNLNKDASYDTKEGSLFGFSVENNEDKLFNECTEEFCNQYVMEEDRSKYIELLNSDRMLANYYRGVRFAELIFRAKLKEEDVRWIRLSLELLEYPDSTDVEAYLMYEDINDSVLEELQIKKQAETDSLTGLQNRKIFIEHVNGLIGQTSKNFYHALFLLDIDYFKHINDTFGHGVGDKSIISMAEVILAVVKDDGLVCRLGGDEFLVYLPDMPSKNSVSDKARELCEAAHITIKNDIQISVSIGVALATDECENFDSMYHKADMALYHVKGHGKNNFAFYEIDMERNDNEVMSDAVSGSLSVLEDGKNIMLVVDDSAINRLVTAGMFKKEFSIAEAENGQAALEFLREHSDEVAIVLLDIMMPVMDGYELLATMKADTTLQAIPVIVISGEDDRKASLKAIKAGASEYIVKPIDVELLRLRVSSALSKAENEKLRKQNSDYAVSRQQLNTYHSLMDSNATVLVEYTAKTGEFKYSPKIGYYLNGTFDERPIWQIFEEDNVASAADSKTVRKMIMTSDKPCKITLDLMTPDGTAHPFLVKVVLREDSEKDDVVLITLTDRK